MPAFVIHKHTRSYVYAQKMLFLCKKFTLLHYFLGFPPIPSSSCSSPSHQNHRGLSLVSADFQRPDHILESARLRSPSSSAKGNMVDNGKKICDEIFGKINGGGGGFMGNTCTESLGFESSDQMELEEDEKKIMVEDRLSNSILDERYIRSLDRKSSSSSSDKQKHEESQKFPPPLSTMNQENGKPNSFLKPVRRDGKLELIQLHIIHPKPIFQASREDGRLRLYFIDPKIQEENEEIKEEEEQDIESKEMVHKDEGSDSSSIRIRFQLMGANNDQGFMSRTCHEHHQHHNHMNRSTVHVL